ncbi:MAG: DNA polymerase III subunit [Kangiellaceae bacterium]|nr:DNA polymerase III subunit [Kangiellaceae bacterium]
MSSNKVIVNFDEYPWVKEPFVQIAEAFNKGKLAHGLMIVSPVNSGKIAFARAIAQSVLCQNTPGSLSPACGNCKSCLLVKSQTHPDFSLLDCLVDNKGKQKQSIGIDQVRQLTSKLVETPQLGGWRIAIVVSVEKMTRGAFNALLKTLEEPGDKTLLLLLANSAHQVPATIKSRCQLVSFNLTSNALIGWLKDKTGRGEEQVIESLKQCLYSPFDTLEYIESGAESGTNEIYSDLDAMLATRVTPNEFILKHADSNEQLWILIANFFQQVQLSILESNQGKYAAVPKYLASELYSLLLEFNRAQCVGSNLQTKLQLEIILIRWFELGRKIVHYSNR